MLLVSLISYIDRNTLALLAPTILRETGLSAESYGWIISGFSVAYMIGNPVWGRLLDRIGLRVGMMAAVAFWTLSSAAHALATGFWSFAAARASLGFGEGATFPGGLRAVTQTLPPAKQARGIALAYSGGSLGAILTPLVVTPIALVWGWRGAFLFTGLIGFGWLVLWVFVSRREDIRRTSLEGDITLETAPEVRFADPRLWSFVAAYALGALPIGFITYGAALYLNRALGVSQASIGKVLWLPPLGWEIGYFCWGWLLDRMASRGVPRMLALHRLMLGASLLSLPLVAVPLVSSFSAVLAMLFFAMFVGVGFILPPVAYGVHIYTKAHSGLVAGIGAGAYGLGVALWMPLFGRLFDQQRWLEAFALAAGLPACGYIWWWMVNRRTIASDSSDRP